MSIHTPDFKQALGQIVRTSRADGRGRIFAVCAAEDQQGTSYCARGLAIAAAGLGFGSLLIDMDISQNAQFDAIMAPDIIRQFGQQSGPFDASFDQEPFWRVSPSSVNAKGQRNSDAGFAALHVLGQGQLSVTQFLWDKIMPGQSVHIAQCRPYWHAIRDRYALTFIDVPALSRSDAGATVFGEVDGTVLITSDSTKPSTKALLGKVSAAGGSCIGAIVNTGVSHQSPRDPGVFG